MIDLYKDLDYKGLEQIVMDFVAAYKRNLIGAGTTATGSLNESIKGKIKQKGKWIEISINLNEYWKYVEKGRKPGKFPPVDAIKEWIKIKPVLPRPYNGKLPTTDQLAFLIGRKIATKGIKPRPILQNTIDTFGLASMLDQWIKSELERLTNNTITEALSEKQ